MTLGPSVPRRVLLAISEPRESGTVLETATRVAGRFGAEVECLVVAQEDMLSLAGLPFARAVASGGLAMPMTASGMEGYFRRLAREVEQDLVARCRTTSLRWHLEQRRGNLLQQVSVAVREGDVVVVGRHDLRIPIQKRFAILRALLSKASAVVLPSTIGRARGPVILPPDLGGDSSALALGVAAALGAEQHMGGRAVRDLLSRQASLIVARIGPTEAEGDGDFLAEIDAAGIATLLLPPAVKAA